MKVNAKMKNDGRRQSTLKINGGKQLDIYFRKHTL